MKSLLKHYRLCNIWICLFIVAMAFTAASDRQYHSLCCSGELDTASDYSEKAAFLRGLPDEKI